MPALNEAQVLRRRSSVIRHLTDASCRCVRDLELQLCRHLSRSKARALLMEAKSAGPKLWD